MQKKILLFDFDGTIANTAEAALKIYNKIAEEEGFRRITKEDIDTLRSRSAIDNIRAFRIPILKVPFIVRHVKAALTKEIPHAKTFEGIREPLQALKEKGYVLMVVSSNSKVNIVSFLEHNKLTMFDDAHSVSNMFGKHVRIKALMKQHGWPANSVMYIGDEVRDIDAAKKAGVTSVAVGWGFNTEDTLRKNSPDRFLRTPSELGTL